MATKPTRLFTMAIAVGIPVYVSIYAGIHYPAVCIALYQIAQVIYWGIFITAILVLLYKYYIIPYLKSGN